MKLLISPAKSLDFESEIPTVKTSNPLFLKQSNSIQTVLRKKKPQELMQLMHISEKLAQLNWERNQHWQIPFPDNSARAAIFAFNGDVYEGFNVKTLDEQHYDFLQKNVRILSGLYGLLHPFDAIMPYRLEMGTALPVQSKQNLYDFWKKIITQKLQEICSNNEPIVNLASKEYFSAVDTKTIGRTIITPEFKDYKNDQLKIISFFAKKARGMMVRFVVENQLTDVEDLKKFNDGGYQFDEKLSTQNKWVFTR